MKDLVEAIAKALVDHPDQVQVNAVEGEQVTVLELKVHPEDLGKVIGRQGRTAKSIRTLLGAAGMKLKKRFTLEISRVVAARRSRSAPRAQRPPQAAQTAQDLKAPLARHATLVHAPGANITVARILRPHGLRGEVAAEILTDFPDRLKKLKSAELWDGKSEPKRFAVRSCWLSHSRGGQAIFHFEGSDSMSDAEKLAGLKCKSRWPTACRCHPAATTFRI